MRCFGERKKSTEIRNIKKETQKSVRNQEVLGSSPSWIPDSSVDFFLSPKHYMGLCWIWDSSNVFCRTLAQVSIPASSSTGQCFQIYMYMYVDEDQMKLLLYILNQQRKKVHFPLVHLRSEIAAVQGCLSDTWLVCSQNIAN